jgi:hypothetical protein
LDTHKHATLIPLCCFPQEAGFRLLVVGHRLVVRSVPSAQLADLVQSVELVQTAGPVQAAELVQAVGPVRSVPSAQVADLVQAVGLAQAVAARLVMPPAPTPLKQEEQPGIAI